MKKIVNKVTDNLNNLIKKDSKILLAISGGKDSVALLNILLDIKEIFNIKIYCCYINHNLRNKESKVEELFVKRYCKSLKLKLFSLSIPTNYWDKIGRDSIEMAARKVRYNFLNKIATQNKIDYIALAHHFNDKIETFFLQILRGGGVETLSSIPIKNKKIIRPLLNVKRDEIEQYILDNNLSYIEDTTNTQNIYKRNIVRNELIPIVKSLNQSYEKTLDNFFKHIDEQNSFLLKLVDKEYLNILISEDTYFISIDKNKFESCDIVIQKYIVKKILEKLCYPTKINQILLKTLTAQKKESTSKKIVYKKESFYCRSLGNYIWFINTDILPDIKSQMVITSLESDYSIDKLKFKIDFKKGIDPKSGFSFSNITKFPIKVRGLLDKDRLPITIANTKKIVDILKDKKIPQILLKTVLVFESNDGKIIGYYLNDFFFRTSKEFYISDYNERNYIFIKN